LFREYDSMPLLETKGTTAAMSYGKIDVGAGAGSHIASILKREKS
jgi:hypothetical protein